jgi:hypothetical protein
MVLLLDLNYRNAVARRRFGKVTSRLHSHGSREIEAALRVKDGLDVVFWLAARRRSRG